ncbi:uncharacterized protein LOC134851593 isoform X2 [Symsagittifera roscoffensis]|uniref:uncharacterized protein LOC134851593 isoform X2 n=1 Tax=Symsagittifera roscoffensis TaxID=84072 RepID=UPI00307CC5AF
MAGSRNCKLGFFLGYAFSCMLFLCYLSTTTENNYQKLVYQHARMHPDRSTATKSLDIIKLKTTSELAKLVLYNCKLTQYFRENLGQTNATLDDKEFTNAVEKIAPEARKRRHGVYYRKENTYYSYCLNFKCASNFLLSLLNQPNAVPPKNYIVSAFMVIREPMHILLSAYLNKLYIFRDQKQFDLFTPLAENIAIYVKRSHKTSSNLYTQPLTSARPGNISFPDFVDYVIHMYLVNNGKIASSEVPTEVSFKDVSTYTVWLHWGSQVADRCLVCAQVFQDVIMFENFEQHLKQVHRKYAPMLFKNKTHIPEIIESQTTLELQRFYDQLTDSQLSFLGNVMYKLDYIILPYNWNDFLQSIGREQVMNYIF